MKVDMNQIADEQAPKKPEPVKKPKPAKKPKPEKKPKSEKKPKRERKPKPDKKTSVLDKNQAEETVAEKQTGNVYAESLKKYKDEIKNGGLFRSNKFWIVLCIVLLVVLLSVNSGFNNTKMGLTMQLRHTTTETEALNNTIDEVKAKLDEQAKIDAVQLPEEQEEVAKANAEEQGTNVAALQNKYRYIDMEADPAGFTGIIESLDACFADSDKNARVEWYSSISGIPGTWEFMSRAPFDGPTAKVLWLCFADTDRMLLAYCTAIYNAETNLFSEVEWKMTGYAAANVKSDGEVPTDIENVTGIQNDLSEIADSNGTAPEEGAPTEEDINRNNEVSESRDFFKDSVANGDVEGEGYDPNYNPGLGNSDTQEQTEDAGTTPANSDGQGQAENPGTAEQPAGQENEEGGES